jgi:hypothetical protein
MMRQEQAAEYQKSLATDRANYEENERRAAEAREQLRRTEDEKRIVRVCMSSCDLMGRMK